MFRAPLGESVSQESSGDKPPFARRRAARSLLVLLLGLGACEAYWFGPMLRRQWQEYWVSAPGETPVGTDSALWLSDGAKQAAVLVERAPGLSLPRTVPAAEATLDDDAPILGVAVAGRHRAYLRSAFESVHAHVVNDLLADVPVTVTHCPLTGCSRAFTAASRGMPLNLDQVGVTHNRFVIAVGDVSYYQDTGAAVESGAPALTPYRLELMTWKEWKLLHPDTDLYR